MLLRVEMLPLLPQFTKLLCLRCAIVHLCPLEEIVPSHLGILRDKITYQSRKSKKNCRGRDRLIGNETVTLCPPPTSSKNENGATAISYLVAVSQFPSAEAD